MKKHRPVRYSEIATHHIINTEEVFFHVTMITRKLLANQLPAETIADRKELRFSHHLRTAGIKKCLGFSVGDLFRLIFSLVFQYRNWFQLLVLSKATDLPDKDAVYRFLNHSRFHWRKFLIGLSSDAMRHVGQLTARDRIKVLIVDDSMYERNRSKELELLARLHDHANQCFYKGFRMFTPGWSDGDTSLPVDFALPSSSKSKLQEASEGIDKRICGWNRRKEALQPMSRVVETDGQLVYLRAASHVHHFAWIASQRHGQGNIAAVSSGKTKHGAERTLGFGTTGTWFRFQHPA